MCHAHISPVQSPIAAILNYSMSHTDQPSSGDVSQGAEPSCLVERDAGNQEAEVKNGAGALELYRSESQILESAPDTSHESHLKSGNSNHGEFNGRGEGIYDPFPRVYLRATIICGYKFYIVDFINSTFSGYSF